MLGSRWQQWHWVHRTAQMPAAGPKSEVEEEDEEDDEEEEEEEDEGEEDDDDDEDKDKDEDEDEGEDEDEDEDDDEEDEDEDEENSPAFWDACHWRRACCRTKRAARPSLSGPPQTQTHQSHHHPGQSRRWAGWPGSTRRT